MVIILGLNNYFNLLLNVFVIFKQLTQHLLQIKRSSNLDKDGLGRYLKLVQEEFIAKMEELL